MRVGETVHALSKPVTAHHFLFVYSQKPRKLSLCVNVCVQWRLELVHQTSPGLSTSPLHPYSLFPVVVGETAERSAALTPVFTLFLFSDATAHPAPFVRANCFVRDTREPRIGTTYRETSRRGSWREFLPLSLGNFRSFWSRSIWTLKYLYPSFYQTFRASWKCARASLTLLCKRLLRASDVIFELL